MFLFVIIVYSKLVVPTLCVSSCMRRRLLNLSIRIVFYVHGKCIVLMCLFHIYMMYTHNLSHDYFCLYDTVSENQTTTPMFVYSEGGVQSPLTPQHKHTLNFLSLKYSSHDSTRQVFIRGVMATPLPSSTI